MPDENNTQSISQDSAPAEEVKPDGVVVPAETAPVPEPVKAEEPVQVPEPAPAKTAEPTTESALVPAPAPIPSVNSGSAISKSFLQRALEKIQFRKRKKLEKILAFARQKGSIGNKQARDLLHCSSATARRYLDKLEKEGKLKQVGTRGPEVRYKVSE